MNKHLLVLLAFMAVIYMGCQKNPYISPPPSLSTSYFPQARGTTWKYRDSLYNEKVDTITLYESKVDTVSYTMTGSASDFNGSFYYDIALSPYQNTVSTAYVYARNHLYALRTTTPPYGPTNLQILIDTASVGHTWVTTITDNTLYKGNPARAVNTIVAKGLSKRIGNTTFTNVYHTRIDVQINTGGAGFHNTLSYDIYLAKGIGLIEKDTYYYGFFNEVETIESYSIK